MSEKEKEELLAAIEMSKVHFENYEQWNKPRQQQQQQQPGWLARWLGGWVSQPSVSRDSGPSGASSTVDDADSEEMLTEHLSHMVVDVQSEASASASVDCGRSAPLLTLGLPGVSAEPLTRYYPANTVARVTPFQRPAGVDPTEHRNFCMAHVARLPECCVNSEPASGTAVTRGKVADRPVAVVSRYTSDADSQELPDLETTERLRYRNHDWVTTRKNRLPLSGRGRADTQQQQQQPAEGPCRKPGNSSDDLFAQSSPECSVRAKAVRQQPPRKAKLTPMSDGDSRRRLRSTNN